MLPYLKIYSYNIELYLGANIILRNLVLELGDWDSTWRSRNV